MKQFSSDQHINDCSILNYQSERIEFFGNTNKNIVKNLIYKQNCQVEKHHSVYLLGDFIITDKISDIFNILNQLNGKIYLMCGNHDPIDKYKCIDLPNKIVVSEKIESITLYNGYVVYMYHYPLYEQPDYYNKKTFHLYGHLHGKRINYNPRALDVSCNIHNFKLLSETKVIELFDSNIINN